VAPVTTEAMAVLVGHPEALPAAVKAKMPNGMAWGPYSDKDATAKGAPTEADAALGFSPNQNCLNLVETLRGLAALNLEGCCVKPTRVLR
jgi:hypothetical protein